VLSVHHYFLSNVPQAYLKNKMKKYQLNLKRIWNLALSNDVAPPWLQRHKNSERMLINVGKTQIWMRFYKLILGSKNTTFSITRNNGGLSKKN